MKLRVLEISKSFHHDLILDKISFEVPEGEFLSILGPSGCGKTTLLRILIGIETAGEGKIFKGEEDITSYEPVKRKMGIVFQNYALFPNMNVLENVLYALKIKGDRANGEKTAIEMLGKVGLSNHLKKRVHQLSGGQQQRVAIARTLVLKPDIILFDEPLSALDAAIRFELAQLFKQIQLDFGITMIYVTHDQEDAFLLSDRILVMRKGKIEQIDTPKNIFNNPKSDFVKEFVGDYLIKKISSLESITGTDL